MILKGENNMINNVEIIAFCPQILSLKNQVIISYIEKSHNLRSNNSSIIKPVYKKTRDWIFVEENRLKIKIFKSGIVEIKENSIESNILNHFSYLSDIAQKVSKDLFHSQAIFDISIFLNGKDDLFDKKCGIFKKDDILSISSTLQDDIYCELRKESSGYWIFIRGIKNANDVPKLFQSILSL